MSLIYVSCSKPLVKLSFPQQHYLHVSLSSNLCHISITKMKILRLLSEYLHYSCQISTIDFCRIKKNKANVGSIYVCLSACDIVLSDKHLPDLHEIEYKLCLKKLSWNSEFYGSRSDGSTLPN